MLRRLSPYGRSGKGIADRSIIHLNIADFAVAVERLIDGRLKHRPVIIASEGTARATVYDMSEEAYRCGVRKGMRLRRPTSLTGISSGKNVHTRLSRAQVPRLDCLQNKWVTQKWDI